jgi:predicted secreted hydrolase
MNSASAKRWPLAAAVVGALSSACDPQSANYPAALGGDNALTVLQATVDDRGYARANPDTKISFPADHGPHDAYRTEWWYVTGNLRDDSGLRYGYQFTIFRNAIKPAPVKSASRWATNQVYMAHFAITDAAEYRFVGHERFARGALGLAGATAQPFSVWLNDWSLREVTDGSPPACDGCLQLALAARAGNVDLQLQLTADKPRVLQGEQGYSVKSERTRSASHYYSLTRLHTRGALHIDGQKSLVEGSSWLDREWSTSALSDDQAGWDWFALQTDSNQELMLYRLRLADGNTDAASAGVIVDGRHAIRRLGHADFALEPLDFWHSNVSRAKYPVAWRIQVPNAQIDLELAPLVDAQEHTGLYRYWEGAVDFTGQWEGQPVSGWGYVELTGY